MRVLLVEPATGHTKTDKPLKTYATFPNGLLYIAAVLEKHGHQVQIYDNNIDLREPKDFIPFAPDIVGFSALTGPDIVQAIAQSIEFKKIMPRVKVVWGNVHPSTLPEQTIREPYIDYVVIGAGEYTLLELVQHLENGIIKLGEIKGLVYKKAGRIFKNEPRPFIKDLDELPDPAWHLVDVKKYWAITLNTSRGCPFRCTFCYNTSFHKGYRGDLSAERIVSQIQQLQKRYGVTSIRFFEDNFTFHHKRLREFCHLVIRKKLKFKWDCEARADLSEEDISLMAKSGCVSVGLGVETGSQRLLSFLKKGVDLNQMEKTFWLLVKHRIAPRLYIMEGVPTETVEDFILTHELLGRLDNPPYLYMKFVPYPGTHLFNYCVTNGLITPPEKLGDWANFTIQSAIKANLSDVPTGIINEAMADFRRTYGMQRLRFTMKHHPSYFLKILFNPLEFFKASKDLVKCTLTYVNSSSNKPNKLKPLSLRALKSSTKAWLREYQSHLEWLVEKQTTGLRRANEQLQRQISQRQQAEEDIHLLYQRESRLRQGLEKQVRQQADFTRALVHELKTPLTPVLAASDLLISESPQEPLLSLARNIERGARNLNKRIDELLDLVKGEADMLKLKCRSVNPLRLLHDVADYVSPEVTRNGHSLVLDLPVSLPLIWADEDRLREVLLNLLSNAFKFTPNGGEITLRGREKDTTLIIEVQDTGCGISEEEQQRLFRPYRQLGSAGDHPSGLGLGLSISKMLVGLHNGKIWVKSQRGEGSVFGFSIPVEIHKKEMPAPGS